MVVVVVPLELCPKLWTWKISPAGRSCLLTTATMVNVSWLEAYSLSHVHLSNTSSPLCGFIADLLYKLFVELCVAADKMLINIVHCAVCLQQQKFLCIYYKRLKPV